MIDERINPAKYPTLARLMSEGAVRLTQDLSFEGTASDGTIVAFGQSLNTVYYRTIAPGPSKKQDRKALESLESYFVACPTPDKW